MAMAIDMRKYSMVFICHVRLGIAGVHCALAWWFWFSRWSLVNSVDSVLVYRNLPIIANLASKYDIETCYGCL